MPRKFDPAHMARLESPERKRLLPPDRILGRFGASAGQAIADIGAGTGLFAFEGARIVGASGKVLAFDMEPEMVAELNRRVADSGLSTLHVLESREYEIPIQPDAVDLAILVTVLHEVDDPARLLREVMRILKPGGRIGIAEWRPDRPLRAGAPHHGEHGHGPQHLHTDHRGPDAEEGGNSAHGPAHGVSDWFSPGSTVAQLVTAGFENAWHEILNESVYLAGGSKALAR